MNVHGEGGTTPLGVAAERNNQKALVQLLQAGADPNAKNEAGQTVLFSAAVRSMVSLVMILLDFGADPRQVCFSDPCDSAISLK